MKLTTSRRLGALALGGLIAAALPVTLPTANAATGNLTYQCAIAGRPATGIPINALLVGPASVRPGTQFQPTMNSKVTLPAELIATTKSTAAGFGVTITGVGGKVTTKVTRNGVTTDVAQDFVSQNFPASGDMVITTKASAAGAMGTITAPSDGVVTFTPGNVVLGLVYATSSGPQNANGNCTMPANATTIGSVIVSNDAPPPAAVKAPSKVSTGVKYVKRTDKLTVAAKVTTTPAQAVAGDVKFALYKKGKKVRSVTKKIGRSNTAKTTFSGKIKKGTYTLVVTYKGSSKVSASKTTRTIKIKK